jgi:lysophospholipase L1-like esterase
MKRFLVWNLPMAAAVIASLAFASGFVLILRGDVGEPVTGGPAADVPAAEARQPGGPLRIVLLGDSLARGTGDDSGLGIGGNLEAELKRRQIAGRPTINLAVNGAKTGDLLAQLESRNVRQIIGQSDVVVISVGGNDLFGDFGAYGAPPKDPEGVMQGVLGRVAGVVREVREANSKARIFVVGLYNPFVSAPEGARINALVNRWNAKLMEKFEGDANVTVVQTSDIFSHRSRLSFDRFHPGREGYALIGRRIAESL